MSQPSERTRTMVGAALLSLSLAAIAQAPPQPAAPAQQPAQEAAKADPAEAVSTRALIAIPLTPVLIPVGETAADETSAGEKAPADKSKDGATVNPFVASGNMFRAAGPGEMEQLRKQAEERRQQLRQQLADPKQRDRVRAERLPQVRSLHPDIDRVLRLDPKTGEQLISVLLEHTLEAELDSGGVTIRSAAGSIASVDDSTRQRAQAYTRRMQEIGKAIGAARLDAFIDYRTSIPQRVRIETFDATLPADGKLGPEQKDAMVLVLAKDMERQLQEWGGRNRGFSGLRLLGLRAATPEERNRSLQIFSLAANERNLERMESAQREVQEQLATLLTPEQSKAFAQQQQQLLNARRAWALQLRRNLGLRADEALDVPEADAAAPLLSTDVRLQLDINVDGKQVTRTLLSKRGGAVTLQMPEGLQIELQPYLVAENDQILMADVKVYETVRGGKRLAHQSGGSISITNPRKGKPAGKSGGGAAVIEGRKGHVFNWSGLATFL